MPCGFLAKRVLSRRRHLLHSNNPGFRQLQTASARQAESSSHPNESDPPQTHHVASVLHNRRPRSHYAGTLKDGADLQLKSGEGRKTKKQNGVPLIRKHDHVYPTKSANSQKFEKQRIKTPVVAVSLGPIYEESATSGVSVRRIAQREAPPIQFFHTSNKNTSNNNVERRLDKQARRWQEGKESNPERDLIDFGHILQLLVDSTPQVEGFRSGEITENIEDESDELSFGDLEGTLDDITYAPRAAAMELRPFHVAEFGRNLHRSEVLSTRPHVLTPPSFAGYVDHLTSRSHFQQVAKARRRESERDYQPFQDDVSNELVFLFTEQRLNHCVNSDALDVCLRFLTRYKKFHHIYRISNRLEDFTYNLTCSNYEALLAAVAREGSMGNFLHYLRRMIRADMNPASNIWISAHGLASRKVPDTVEAIEEIMHRKGLLGSPAVVAGIAEHNIPKDLSAAMTNGVALEAFLCACDTRYGQDRAWLTASTTNRILAVLLEQGESREALKFYGEVRDRPDCVRIGEFKQTSATDVFIAAALRATDMRAAVSLLRALTGGCSEGAEETAQASAHEFKAGGYGQRATSTSAVENNAMAQLEVGYLAYGMLFQLAWKTRHFNSVRVVWRYACATGNITQTMLTRMKHSIHTDRPLPTHNSVHDADAVSSGHGQNQRLIPPEVKEAAWKARAEQWDFWAGRFALGVHRDLEAGVSKAEEASERPRREPNISLLPLEEQQRQLQLDVNDATKTRPLAARMSCPRRVLRILYKRDMLRGTAFHPVQPFVDILEQAWKLDLEWKEGGLNLTKAVLDPTVFDQMFERGLDVPMEGGYQYWAEHTTSQDQYKDDVPSSYAPFAAG